MRPRYPGDSKAQQLRDYCRVAKVAEHLANMRGTPPAEFREQLREIAVRFGVAPEVAR